MNENNEKKGNSNSNSFIELLLVIIIAILIIFGYNYYKERQEKIKEKEEQQKIIDDTVKSINQLNKYIKWDYYYLVSLSKELFIISFFIKNLFLNLRNNNVSFILIKLNIFMLGVEPTVVSTLQGSLIIKFLS